MIYVRGYVGTHPRPRRLSEITFETPSEIEVGELRASVFQGYKFPKVVLLIDVREGRK